MKSKNNEPGRKIYSNNDLNILMVEHQPERDFKDNNLKNSQLFYS